MQKDRFKKEKWQRERGDGKKLKDREKILKISESELTEWLLEISHFFVFVVTLDLVTEPTLNISIQFSKMRRLDLYLLNTKTTVQKSNHHSAENYTPYLGRVHKIRATSRNGSALKHSVFQNDYLKHIYSYANSTFPFMLFSGCFSN